MTPQNQNLGSDEMHEVWQAMRVRMRNYALHQFSSINARTATILQELALFENPNEPIGGEVDLSVLRDPTHPRRVKLPCGPLVLYHTEEKKPGRMAVELPMLLYSELEEVRKTALACLEQLIACGGLDVTPKTRNVLRASRANLISGNPHDWRPAAVASCDALYDDVLVALHGVRQSLEGSPTIQDTLNFFVPRILHPAISSLDSIALDPRNPEREHARLAEIVQLSVAEAHSLPEACAKYFERLGYLPLAPRYAMAEVVIRWMAAHADSDSWSEVWSWAHSASGPLPKYHACAVFVLHPELVPPNKLSELWAEILGVVCESGRKDDTDCGHEAWLLRRDLVRHFAHHLESHLPDNGGANVDCFAWWFAEQVAALFPDKPETAQFYRKNWAKPAADQSSHLWLVASPRIGRSYLRCVTFTVSYPWATSLLALMGEKLGDLLPGEQSAETQTKFNAALVLNLMSAFPFSTCTPPDPTYAMECSMSELVLKWAKYQPEGQQNGLEQLIATNRLLGSDDGLCNALRKMAEASVEDQIAIALALKKRAYAVPGAAEGIWEILSDGEWRQRVLGALDERVLGLLVESFNLLQMDNPDKRALLLPHYLAELCEKVETDERRRHLFLYVLYTSLALDSVGAIRRLLRGTHKAKYVELVKDYRERVGAVWAQYPQWVAGKLRGLLASLRIA